ncbi:MAG: site-specific integrase [Candidatus Nitrosopolaris sp.]
MDQVILSTLYRNFLESIKSDATKYLYSWHFQKFVRFIGGDDKLIREHEKLTESQVIDYIVTRRKQNYSYAYLASSISAIFHFYTMNDINLNRKKISRFMGNNEKKCKDVGYTTEQIHKLLDVCDDRLKVVILLFASTGIRLAALPSLKVKHIFPLSPDASIYRLTIYEKSREEYITFCTPECTKALNAYLEYRERSGEKLETNSPLIREQFNRNDIINVKHPKHITKSTLSKLVGEKLRQAGIRDLHHSIENVGDRAKNRKDVPLIHGFRKFFNTALMNADVHPSFKKLLMGHSVQLDEVYYDKNSPKSHNKLLEEYSKAIECLTINEENRLRKKVEVLKAKRDEIEMLKGQVQQKDDRLSLIEKQMQSLVSTLSKLTEQGQVNTVAQTLYSSGILKEGKKQLSNKRETYSG